MNRTLLETGLATILPLPGGLALSTIITSLDKFCFHAEVSKPRRGGLFIDRDHTTTSFLFVFRRRDSSNFVTRRAIAAHIHLGTIAPPSRRRKIKRKIRAVSVSINRPPLRGLSSEAARLSDEDAQRIIIRVGIFVC